MSAIVTYPTTENLHADPSKITLDKILQALNGGAGGSGGGGGAVGCGCVIQGHGVPSAAPALPLIPYYYTDLDTGVGFYWDVELQQWA